MRILEKNKKKIQREYFENEAELDTEEMALGRRPFLREDVEDEKESENDDNSDQELIDYENYDFNQEDENGAKRKFLQDLIDQDEREMQEIIERRTRNQTQQNDDQNWRTLQERRSQLERLKNVQIFHEG